ncbi:MAG: DNA primase [Minisyncoccia bacterium]
MAQDTVAQIKDRLSIVDVVGSVVKLRKAGRSYVGLCPFHKEKTPSFHVSLERGSYHCFGCGEGGDIFTFTEKTEGVDFKGALKILAERAGVVLEYSGGDKKEKNRAERLREAMARAAEFYTAQLVEGGAAYSYARSRGLHAETIKEWSLGYAPDSWRALLEHLAALGFANDELLAAGLIKEAVEKPGTYYDRFRSRLMFPIRDTAGRVVGFTGRALALDEPAKYLNSPETELYHKSEILFGLDRAKDAIRTRSFALLVEGQMDLLMAHQAGWPNSVAVSGTALTPFHLALIKRYAQNLMLVLDADPAGFAATAKAAELALKAGLRVKIVALPAGKDPADLLVEDSKDFGDRVKEAKSVIEFFLSTLAEREKNAQRFFREAEKIVVPLVAAIPSPLDRDRAIETLSRAAGMSPDAIKEAIRRLPKVHEVRLSAVAESHSSVVAHKESAREIRARALAAIASAYPGTPLAELVGKEYNRIVDAPLAAGVSEADIFSIETAFSENPPEDAADDLIRAFEEAHLREAYQEMIGELRRAEAAGEQTAIEEAQRSVEAFSKRLRAFSR